MTKPAQKQQNPRTGPLRAEAINKPQLLQIKVSKLKYFQC